MTASSREGEGDKEQADLQEGNRKKEERTSGSCKKKETGRRNKWQL